MPTAPSTSTSGLKRRPAPAAAKNWIQTTPGKGWFMLFRFYGPLEPFFDKTWKPDDIVEAHVVTSHFVRGGSVRA